MTDRGQHALSGKGGSIFHMSFSFGIVGFFVRVSSCNFVDRSHLSAKKRSTN
jgi:hypothetical protein